MNRESILPETERQELLNDIVEQVQDFCTRCRKGGAEDLAAEFLSEERAREHLHMLETLAGRPLRGSSLLEIGAGYGMFLAAARRCAGVESFGIEPGVDDYVSRSVARRLLRAANIRDTVIVYAEGENLPFREESFDIVYSSNVLEHVRDPEAVIHEGFRAVKPGGRVVFVVPNYRSFWEGHYRLPWLPIFNRLWLGKAYVKLWGRDPAFLDTLHFVTPAKVRKWVSTLPANHRLVTMGEEICAKRLKDLSFGSWGGLDGIRRAVGVLQRWGLSPVAIKFLNILEAYTPLILVIEKA